MNARILGGILTALLAVTGCSRPDSTPAVSGRAQAERSSTQSPASFVNRVWIVAESKQVAPGELRVFLSEGTLVMASAHGTPAFGTWRHDGGHLTITEEGREYTVEILELNENALRIRIHRPGEPVDIRFEPSSKCATEF
ncbi:MAG: hypothetical protein ACREMW_07865 [Gemmatimonadales bacterium]